MWGINSQAGVVVAGVVSSPPSRFRNAHNSGGGFASSSTSASTSSSRCCCSALLLSTRNRGGGEARLAGFRNPSFHAPLPLLSWAASPRKRRKGGALCCTAGLGFEVTPATVVVLSSVLSFAALRTYVYFRMEYIIAAMLGRHVPRGGAKVVELNIRGGRSLYYYPADILQVVAVSSKPNVQLLENQATRAGVPIQIKRNSPTALGIPSSSVDAVVSVFCLCDTPDREVLDVLREAVRVLKPGKPFIFVEAVGAKNPVIRRAQSVVGGLLSLAGTKRATTRDLLPYIQEVEDLEEVDYEEVLSFIDPHLVGVAKKKLSVIREPSKEVRKGFKKSKA